MTAINGTIPDSPMLGVQQYDTQDPTAAGSPGVIVPPAVLQVLMKTSTALAPKPSAAPPHPQVTAPLAAIPLGYQFAFNQLTSPTPYGNTITAYRIYRNKTSNNFSGSQLIRTITHDPTHQGAVTVQDSTGGNVNYFYFVTAVDSTGQESSSPGAFQASSVTSGTANPNVHGVAGTVPTPSQTGTTYAVISGMTLTFTTKGNSVYLLFTGSISTTANGGFMAIFKDGVQLTTDFFVDTAAVTSCSIVGLAFLDTPTAASHTYDVRWKAVAAQTIEAQGTAYTFQAVELG